MESKQKVLEQCPYLNRHFWHSDEFVYEGRAEHVTLADIPEVGPNLTEK